MTENEKRLKDVLQRLIEILDSACISFDEMGGDDAVEIALEFDEAYLAACEALGMDLGQETGESTHAVQKPQSGTEPAVASRRPASPGASAAGSVSRAPAPHTAPMHR